ncbi:amidohydrolase family protein [Paraburkholderia sp. JHI869]|uniref:amidohydrolase family protein n=1 Tax=Paraburkholderia sp. JHI869 TaxID=3112959 RepID=UPI00317FEB9E
MRAEAFRHHDRFCEHRPTQGQVRRTRSATADRGARRARLQVSPHDAGLFANDRLAYPLYEVIAEHGLPAVFHSGHSGMGSGMRGGGGLRLKYSEPIHLDDVAADFPDMKIVIAHPSWPWQEQALSIALHKPNVYIDLSGWSPKYFSPELVKYTNTLLRHKVLFASDFPLIRPDRWLEDFATLDIKPDVRPLVLKENAIRLLGLDGAT